MLQKNYRLTNIGEWTQHPGLLINRSIKPFF